MPIKDALEVFIEILVGPRAQLVEDASHLYPGIAMGIAPIASSDQEAIALLTELAQDRNIIMAVTQHEAHLGGDFPQQVGGRLTVSERSQQSTPQR